MFGGFEILYKCKKRKESGKPWVSERVLLFPLGLYHLLALNGGKQMFLSRRMESRGGRRRMAVSPKDLKEAEEDGLESQRTIGRESEIERDQETKPGRFFSGGFI